MLMRPSCALVLILWLLLPAAAACAQCELRWRQVSSEIQPTVVDGWATAYDASRNLLWVVESTTTVVGTRRLWAWDGRHWRTEGFGLPLSSLVPVQLVFDSHRDRLVAIAAEADGPVIREWDGAQWLLRQLPAGAPRPAPRTGPAVAFDPARGVTVYVAGLRAADAPSDHWTWDGQAWVEHPVPPTLTPRAHAALIYDPVRQVMVLHGGQIHRPTVGWLTLTSTWEWDGQSWERRTLAGPALRSPQHLAFDARTGSPVALDWPTSQLAPSQLAAWDGQAWTSLTMDVPVVGPGAVLTFHAAVGELILLGGVLHQYGAAEAPMAFNGTRWRHLATAPAPRMCRMAFDPVRGCTVLVGGDAEQSFAQIWEWDPSGWQLRFDPQRSVRSELAAAYFPPLGGVAAVGGRKGTDEEFMVQVWDGMQWSSGPDRPPIGRSRHAVVHDTIRNRLILFGGKRNSPWTAFNDTWELAAGATMWTQVHGLGPSVRYDHAMAFDSRRGKVVLFGSAASGNAETWEYDVATQTWALRATTGPAGRSRPAMAYDADRGVTLLFGGIAPGANRPTALGDLWEWDGQAWTRLHLPGPSPSVRGGGGMSYDADRRLILLHGGFRIHTLPTGGPYLGDTWILHNPADHNLDGTINAADIAAFTQTWLRSRREGTLDADYDLSGDVTPADLTAFIQAVRRAIRSGC